MALKYQKSFPIGVPHFSKVPHKTTGKDVVTIRGQILSNPNNFKVSLIENLHSITTKDYDSIVNFKVSFFKELIVISHKNGHLKNKVKKDNVFKESSNFDLRILFGEFDYKFYFNRKLFATYSFDKYKAPLIDHYEVTGDVLIDEIRWSNQNLEIPFTSSFLNNSLNCEECIHISGIPYNDFSVNIMGENNNVLFHINPRFNIEQIIYNSKFNGVWGPEVREKPIFFEKNEIFDLILQNSFDGMVVYINKLYVSKYNHRADLYNDYKWLSIEGQVKLLSVEIGDAN